MKNARIQEIKSLELGIIGCARANKLVEVLSKATCDVTITAILDIDDDILDDFHSKNPNIAKFSCEKKFFSSGLFEAIYIASPAHLHFNHSLLAIKYNKHTLCEVPAVQNINQGLILFKKFKN